MPPKRISLQKALQLLRMQEDQDASSDDNEAVDEHLPQGRVEAGDAENVDLHMYNEESDGEVEIQYDDSEEESSSDNDETITNDTYTEAADTTNEESFTSPNGIEWLAEKPRGRLLARNIINFHPGPTVQPSSESESFSFFITEPILRTILRHTNRRVVALGRKPFTYAELKAGLAIIIRAGADRDNISLIESLFDPKDSKPFYSCAMSKNRIRLLLRHITLDNKADRRERQVDDKLAAVREIWSLFQLNLRQCYTPSMDLTVDE